MPLTRVTITGADDGVEPEALFDLSAEFPFVEWGILQSTSQRGRPRFPSESWLEKLIDERIAQHGRKRVALSAHLCGKLARCTLEGHESAFIGNAWPFERVQINGFSGDNPPSPEFLGLLKSYPGLEFILQLRSASDWLRAHEIATDTPNVVGLFDASGGLGVRPTEWPESPSSKLRCGFAGGITPENVSETLDALSARPESFWIDLESGARISDRFDLNRVRTVIERAANYIAVYQG